MIQGWVFLELEKEPARSQPLHWDTRLHKIQAEGAKCLSGDTGDPEPVSGGVTIK